MANSKTIITYSETEKCLYAGTENYRLWYTKDNGTLRLKLHGMDTIYYVSKDTKMYRDMMKDFFGKEV